MSTSSSGHDDNHLEQPATSDNQGKDMNSDDDVMQSVGGGASSLQSPRMGEERERMIRQFETVLNNEESELPSSSDIPCERTDTINQGNCLVHQRIGDHDNGDSWGCSDSDFGNVSVTANDSEICYGKNNKFDGSSVDNSLQADSYTHYKSIGDSDKIDESVKEVTSSESSDVTCRSVDDSDDINMTDDTTSSSSPPPSNSTEAVASSTQQGTSQHVPDIVSTHESQQTIPARPEELNSGASSVSRNFVQRCACTDTEHCPKRSAAIFTELVADVGGCLCSRRNVRDRLPPGWPDFFDPLPDVVASQRSPESQVSAAEAE